MAAAAAVWSSRLANAFAVWSSRLADAFFIALAFSLPLFATVSTAPLVALVCVGACCLLRYRWQQVPALTAIALHVGLLVVAPRGIPFGLWLLQAGLGLVASALSLLLCLLLPIPLYPAVRGPHGVGCVRVNLVDAERLMWPQYPGLCKGPRVLPTIVWYPANAADPTYTRRPRAPYLNSRAKRRSLAKCFKMPAWLLDHMERYATRARVGATAWTPSAADGRLPVVLFSHSWTGCREQSSLLCEELASLGFVVLAPDHCGDCPLSEFVEDVDIDVEASGSPPCPAAVGLMVYMGFSNAIDWFAALTSGSRTSSGGEGPSRQLASLLESMAGAFGSMSKGGLRGAVEEHGAHAVGSAFLGLHAFRQFQLRHRAADISFLLDCLEHLHTHGPTADDSRPHHHPHALTLAPSLSHLLSRPYIHQARYLLAMRLRWASSACQGYALCSTSRRTSTSGVCMPPANPSEAAPRRTHALSTRASAAALGSTHGCGRSQAAAHLSRRSLARRRRRSGSAAWHALHSHRSISNESAADRHASPRAPRVPRGAWVTPRSPR